MNVFSARVVVLTVVLTARSSLAVAAGAPFMVDALHPDSPASAASTFTDSDGGNYHGRIPYNGGPVVTQVRVVAVFWGGQVAPAVVSGVGGFYSALVAGSFMHFVSEYSTITQTIGAYGTFLGSFTIAPINASAALTDAEVSAELAQHIAAGALPAPDSNTVYMLHFPPGVSITGPRTIGTSCVDFCSYHYASSDGLLYVVVPDQSGGCAPGPPGCNTSTTSHCCGDKSAFDNLTKTASHELMETITDPFPTNLAWQDVLGGDGEIGDPCNFSRVGDEAYTPVVDANGRTYWAQKGFSDAAFLAGLGTHRGCVGFPTTLCCEVATPQADASTPPPASCSWLPNGKTSCAVAASDLTVSVPTLEGSGSATVSPLRFAPFSGVCLPSGATGRRPDYCADIQAVGVIEQGVATVTLAVDAQHPDEEDCFGASGTSGCPSGTSSVRGSCCAPTVPFVVSGATQSVQTTIPGLPLATALVPAVPGRAAAFFGTLLLGLGAFATRRIRHGPASERQGER